MRNNNEGAKNKSKLNNPRAMLKFKIQMRRHKCPKAKHRQRGGVHFYTLQKFTFCKQHHTPLKATAKTLYPQMFFEWAIKQIFGDG